MNDHPVVIHETARHLMREIASLRCDLAVPTSDRLGRLAATTRTALAARYQPLRVRQPVERAPQMTRVGN